MINKIQRKYLSWAGVLLVMSIIAYSLLGVTAQSKQATFDHHVLSWTSWDLISINGEEPTGIGHPRLSITFDEHWFSFTSTSGNYNVIENRIEFIGRTGRDIYISTEDGEKIPSHEHDAIINNLYQEGGIFEIINDRLIINSNNTEFIFTKSDLPQVTLQEGQWLDESHDMTFNINENNEVYGRAICQEYVGSVNIQEETTDSGLFTFERLEVTSSNCADKKDLERSSYLLDRFEQTNHFHIRGHSIYFLGNPDSVEREAEEFDPLTGRFIHKE